MSIHQDRTKQHIDVRLYFEKDEDTYKLHDSIAEALSDIPELISAYELVSDGSGRLVPDERPIA